MQIASKLLVRTPSFVLLPVSSTSSQNGQHHRSRSSGHQRLGCYYRLAGRARLQRYRNLSQNCSNLPSNLSCLRFWHCQSTQSNGNSRGRSCTMATHARHRMRNKRQVALFSNRTGVEYECDMLDDIVHLSAEELKCGLLGFY